MSSTPSPQSSGGHYRAPIRRPHARPLTVVLWFAWLIGVGLGVVVPALLSPPDQTGSGHIRTAMVFSVAGVLVMAFTGFVLYVRTKEVGVLLLTVVPSIVVIIAAFALMGMKLFV
jgi:hypothetical protein